MVKIFVDADACPVKKEISTVAARYNIPVHYVASYAHITTNQPEETWTYVDNEKESVDMFIMNNTRARDIVITHDIGLASILLTKFVKVLSPKGRLFSEDTIETALYLRYISAKERKRGHFTKGPKPFSELNRLQFIKSLEKILSNHAGE
ncbi:YaiI/YqxD family protein [Bacillus sp. FJAT-47783]|uniref:YaiI/YqxD family protein n=1 Tax=Bacillus sp. FJAT-47783 TaxID=2922712 RepID=UPI001FABD0B8|nr:YaiI/YqxD family protein [Bacillus sp. FJAT-47783]